MRESRSSRYSVSMPPIPSRVWNTTRESNGVVCRFRACRMSSGKRVGYVQLVIGGNGGGVQKSITFIVEQIFPVVGEIQHGRSFSGSVEFIDNLCQEFVGGNDRVVIGIYHGLLVLMIDFFNVVGGEYSTIGIVSFTVIEVGAIGVKDNELLRFTYVQ